MASGAVPPPPPPPPPAETRASRPTRARPRVLTGLSCASCGGTVDVAEGRTNVECRFCGTPQAVVGERGVVRLMVLDRVERRQATEAVRDWLGRGIRKDPALRREAKLEEAFLAWFPFVRARLDAIGWVLGTRSERRKRGNRSETVTVPVERAVEREVDLTVPAADMAEFGVHRVSLAGDEILPLDEEALRSRGMVFRPSRSLEEMAGRLRERALEEARRGAGLDRVTFSWLTSVRRRVGLVFYPLWVVRYGFRGRTYQVLVDAEDGSLAYGKAPGNHLYRAACLVAACAGAAFVGTSLLQHLDVLFRSDNALQALAMVGLVLAGTVYWGYRQFRHGGVVEEGSGLADDRSGADLAATVKGVVERFQ
ncbi:MAG TPA: hypothetical protein VLB51_17675 [Methylomirabilota bacterium]|nr:hypothetical protein [Methylomirabilota bacterium]